MVVLSCCWDLLGLFYLMYFLSFQAGPPVSPFDVQELGQAGTPVSPFDVQERAQAGTPVSPGVQERAQAGHPPSPFDVTEQPPASPWDPTYGGRRIG